MVLALGARLACFQNAPQLKYSRVLGDRFWCSHGRRVGDSGSGSSHHGYAKDDGGELHVVLDAAKSVRCTEGVEMSLGGREDLLIESCPETEAD